MFNKEIYIKEMTEMVNKAIERMKNEKPNFIIFTTSIWTDPNSTASSIGFDSKKNSLKNVEKSNEWDKKYYEEYLAKGDLEMAELFKPDEATRMCNPAVYDLKDFEEITNLSFPTNWESETKGNCWKELTPALREIGKYTFDQIKQLNLEDGFELSINNKKDWYGKTWKIK